MYFYKNELVQEEEGGVPIRAETDSEQQEPLGDSTDKSSFRESSIQEKDNDKGGVRIDGTTSSGGSEGEEDQQGGVRIDDTKIGYKRQEPLSDTTSSGGSEGEEDQQGGVQIDS